MHVHTIRYTCHVYFTSNYVNEFIFCSAAQSRIDIEVHLMRGGEGAIGVSLSSSGDVFINKLLPLIVSIVN